ncbi:MAG: hypothetical protein H0T56_09050 [Pseudaminobacter sp.]|nr:hypothetical protein [Pseudaminobacter sp.]
MASLRAKPGQLRIFEMFGSSNSPNLVAGVWVGNDGETPMNEITGGELPSEIWRNFLG